MREQPFKPCSPHSWNKERDNKDSPRIKRERCGACKRERRIVDGHKKWW